MAEDGDPAPVAAPSSPVEPATDAALHVPAPYRRGPQAVRACLDQIDTLLRVVAPAPTDPRRIAP